MNDEQLQLKKLISINSWSVAIQLVILATVVGGVFIIAGELRVTPGTRGSNPAVAMGAVVGSIENWNEYVRPYSATLGSSEPMVTVLEFTDFQCPYCKSFSENARRQLLMKYEGKIQFVLKNFPLEAAHPEAKMAAIAAQCGRRSGKFWELERALFANSKVLNEQFVRSMGKDMELGIEFDTCVSEQQTLSEVEQDVRDGLAIGVQGTPMFLVNGRVALGALSPELIDTAIEAAARRP